MPPLQQQQSGYIGVDLAVVPDVCSTRHRDEDDEDEDDATRASACGAEKGHG